MRLHQQLKLTITPLSHQSIHATNVIKLSLDRYLVVWFGGTREKHVDTAIWGCFINNGEVTEPRLIAKVMDIPHWNPILDYDDGMITCYFKIGWNCSTWKTWYITSVDGYEWSRPAMLINGDMSGRGPSKNKLYKLSNGHVIAPASSELNGRWMSYFDRRELDDDGETRWLPSYPIYNDEVSLIQPAVWESTPGNVHTLMRSNNGYMWRSDSDDYGITWTKPYQTELPNNNSGIDITRFNDSIIIVCNPTNTNWGRRSPLSLIISNDLGKTWDRLLNIEDNDDCEFSYPSIISIDNGIAITYTIGRRSVGFVSMLVDTNISMNYLEHNG